MGSKEFTLKYGKKTVSFEIQEEMLFYELLGRNQPAYEDLRDAYRFALDHAIDAPPLKEPVHFQFFGDNINGPANL